MQKIPARTNAASIRRGGDLQVQGTENLPFLLSSLQRTFDKEKTYPNPFLYKIGFGYALFGGRYRTRTCDLLHVKQMLYQLS